MPFPRGVLTDPGSTNVRSYDITPDGQRFIGVVTPEAGSSDPQIQVVLNWFEDLKQRARIIVQTGSVKDKP